MLEHNRRLLILFGVMFIVLYVLISASFYSLLLKTSKEKSERELYDILLYEKAQKNYIDKYQKPVIFRLQEKGLLSKDFFSPALMSATFITRNTLKEYNKLRKKHHLLPVQYKISSDNPRNPVNKASKEELELLKKFNERKMCEYKKEITLNGKKYLYYAIPVQPNNHICLKCHSDPKVAPKGLVEIYGDKAGFGEKEGHIRAFFSLSIPFESELAFVKEISFVFNVAILFLFVFAYAIIYIIIKKLDKRDKELLKNIHIDALTKLYNRKKFNEDLIHCNLDNKYLLLADIDHFKKINDTYGHHAGDEVLEKVAQILKDVAKDAKVYRIGGEEFAIIAPATSKEEAQTLAQNIRKAIENAKFKIPKKVTISIGYTKINPDENYIEWFKKADKALYEAKKTRNKVVGF
ncbi:MAG: diguanylate cyclase [Epsilonproteobacteria bacterium]|nr:diguanylate cyclase [Campylobacterota bacterium]